MLSTSINVYLTIYCFRDSMSALFNFQSLLTVILLCICTCAYIRSFWPGILDRSHLPTIALHNHITNTSIC